MLRRGALSAGRRLIRLDQQSTFALSNHLSQQTSVATSTAFRAWFSSYPPHEVVGLPALSPVRNSRRAKRLSCRVFVIFSETDQLIIFQNLI